MGAFKHLQINCDKLAGRCVTAMVSSSEANSIRSNCIESVNTLVKSSVVVLMSAFLFLMTGLGDLIMKV